MAGQQDEIDADRDAILAQNTRIQTAFNTLEAQLAAAIAAGSVPPAALDLTGLKAAIAGETAITT